MAHVDRFAGVIFDYGGVLASHQTEDDKRRLANLAGVPAPLFGELYWADRARYDRGDISAVEYWHEIGQKTGKPLTDKTIAQMVDCDSRSWMKFNREMYVFAHGLGRRGIRIAILSNMPRELGEAIQADGFGFSGFDPVTLSYEVRAAKPQPAIYNECLKDIGTRPGETLFLDDRAENVKAAQALGIQAMEFTFPEEMLKRLNGNS
jgi:putative hydrolase of the HAD superfamily